MPVIYKTCCNIMNLYKQKLKIIHQGRLLCRTGCEVLKLKKKILSNNHEKINGLSYIIIH